MIDIEWWDESISMAAELIFPKSHNLSASSASSVKVLEIRWL
jgi:hypothetical protein